MVRPVEILRAFEPGQVVDVTLKVYRIGTRYLADPDLVELAEWKKDGAHVNLPDPSTFVRMSTGIYTLSIDTNGLDEAVYDLMMKVTKNGTPPVVRTVRDSFVLGSPDVVA